jgi:hypothetical protein
MGEGNKIYILGKSYLHKVFGILKDLVLHPINYFTPPFYIKNGLNNVHFVQSMALFILLLKLLQF